MAYLFTSQTPAGGFFDGSPITVATTVVFAVDGQVTGGRFYSRATNPGGTYELVLWQPVLEDGTPGTGTLLAQATFGTIADGTWNEILFAAPVAVVAGQPYKISMRTSVGAYTATSAFFQSSGLTNGDITGPQTNTFLPGYGAFFNGSFKPDLTGYPNQTFEGACYFVDALFVADGTDVELAATLTMDGSLSAALTREVPLSAALTATGSLSATFTNDTQLSASLSMNGSLAVAFTVPVAPPADPIAAPIAAQLLACFTEQLSALPSPPKYIQMRVGQETGPLIGPGVDECCSGLAWVRVDSVYPSWDSFPQADNTWLPCGPLAYAVVLEMGMAFCMPWSDSDGSFEDLDPPSTLDWAAAFETQMRDQTIMRRTAACCFLPTQRRAVGAWTALPVEGGCTGGKLTVTVSVMNPCSDC